MPHKGAMQILLRHEQKHMGPTQSKKTALQDPSVCLSIPKIQNSAF